MTPAEAGLSDLAHALGGNMNKTANKTWQTAVTFALDASSEQEAEHLLGIVLDKMGLITGRTVSLNKSAERLWIASVELDLSELVDPDSPKNYAAYVAGQTHVAWHTISPREGLLIWEWPSPLWLTELEPRGFLHPAVRAVLIRIDQKPVAASTAASR